MSHVLRRRGSEVYPVRGAFSAAAQLPFARLSLSGNAAFTEGVQTPIPFDTVDYESSSFDGFETEGGASLFFVPFGVYLVVLQVIINTSPTQLAVGVVVQSNSGADVGGSTSTLETGTVSMSGVRLGSETPIPGHVLPVAVVPSIIPTGGGNGNILAAQTRMLVWQLAQFATATP